jgi:hypothetical protein
MKDLGGEGISNDKSTTGRQGPVASRRLRITCKYDETIQPEWKCE